MLSTRDVRALEGPEKLRTLLERGNGELAAFLREQHPVDLADMVEELPDDLLVALFEHLDPEQSALVLGELDRDARARIVRLLGKERVGDIVEAMDTDDAADLLGELSPEQAGQILGELQAEEAAEVRELLHYEPDTAGGIMTTEYVAVNQGMTAQEAIEHLRRRAPDAETVYYVYVVDDDEHLLGVLSLRDLIVAPPETPLKHIMRTKVVSVFHDQDQEEVARVVSRYDLLAVPVIDHQRRLLGVVTVDDVIDVLEEEATEDALRAAAVSPGEEGGDLRGGVWRLARPRLPWLLALLFMEFLAGSVIDRFRGGFDGVTLALLSVFIPIMAGEAGNGATQALAVVVRGLATGEIAEREVLAVVWREARVGVLVGLITGIVLFGATTLWKGDLRLGLVVGLALALNLPVAKVLGGLFPILIHRLGIDPAVASGPFITTVTDFTSMLTYFSVAALLLTQLG